MLDTTYREKILEEILREQLQDGVVPTADELEELFDARTKYHPDFSLPMIRDKNYEVTRRSKSNATKFNDFFSRARSDLKVLYTEIWDQMLDGEGSFSRWRIEVERLKKELLALERRIDGLLFLRQDTEGYFDFVEETFVDFTNVDQESTTARVDVVNHQVTIDTKAAVEDKIKVTAPFAQKSSISSINPGRFTNENLNFAMSFVVLTRDDVVASRLADNTTLKDAFADSTKYWQQRVYTTRGDKPISAELKLKLGPTPVQITGITMSLHSANNRSPVTVIAQYSTDGYNWYNVPTENYTQAIDDYGVFHFSKTHMTWVKFIMTKFGPDDTDGELFVYEFGANLIKFLQSSYPTSTSAPAGIYQSEYLSAYDDDDNRKPFHKVSLRTCQETPTDTSLVYTIKAGNETNESDWLRISPADLEQAEAPTIIEFGKSDWYEYEMPGLDPDQIALIKWIELLIDMHFGFLGVLAKTHSASETYFKQYSDVLNIDKLALLYTYTTDEGSWTPHSIPTSTMPNVRDLVLYRNTGTIGGDDYTVRENPRGWHAEREVDLQGYISTILFTDSDVTIDLGGATAYLDNKPLSGKITITKGNHMFRTHQKNFEAVAALDPATNLAWASEGALEVADPLYPYNHRKLIEGVVYADDFDGQKIYNGIDLYSEYHLQRVSIFDLMHNIADTDYSKYAVDTFGDDQVFVVKYDPTTDDWDREAITIRYRTADSDSYDRIKLKASLHTTNPLKTPVLSAYRIKLG